MSKECPSCQKGELQQISTWQRYKTPFNYRLCSEQPIYGTVYRCDNCLEFFFNDEEDEELKTGQHC